MSLLSRFNWSLLLTLFFVGFMLSPAAGQTAVGGARSVAMGGATTGLLGEVWSDKNAALPATLNDRAVAFGASQGFGLAALRTGQLQYVEPFSFGNLSVTAQSFGFEDYRASKFGLGFSHAFSLGTKRFVYAGVQLSYNHVAISNGYGSDGALGVSLGGLVNLMSNLSLGFQATNVNFPKLGQGEELPRNFSLGLAYRPAENATIVFDVFKDVLFPTSIRAGVEVFPIDMIALRGGIQTQPTQFSMGVGFKSGKILADVAAQYHEVLGLSPAVSFGLAW